MPKPPESPHWVFDAVPPSGQRRGGDPSEPPPAPPGGRRSRAMALPRYHRRPRVHPPPLECRGGHLPLALLAPQHPPRQQLLRPPVVDRRTDRRRRPRLRTHPQGPALGGPCHCAVRTKFQPLLPAGEGVHRRPRRRTRRHHPPRRPRAHPRARAPPTRSAHRGRYYQHPAQRARPDIALSTSRRAPRRSARRRRRIRCGSRRSTLRASARPAMPASRRVRPLSQQPRRHRRDSCGLSGSPAALRSGWGSPGG